MLSQKGFTTITRCTAVYCTTQQKFIYLSTKIFFAEMKNPNCDSRWNLLSEFVHNKLLSASSICNWIHLLIGKITLYRESIFLSPILLHFVIECHFFSLAATVPCSVIACDFAVMDIALKLAVVSSSVQKCEQIKAEMLPILARIAGLGNLINIKEIQHWSGPRVVFSSWEQQRWELQISPTQIKAFGLVRYFE